MAIIKEFRTSDKEDENFQIMEGVKRPKRLIFIAVLGQKKAPFQLFILEKKEVVSATFFHKLSFGCNKKADSFQLKFHLNSSKNSRSLH